MSAAADSEGDADRIGAAKIALRAEMAERGRAADERSRREAAARATRRLLAVEEIAEAESILFYMPLRSELDVTAAILDRLRSGVRVSVPRIDEESRELEAVAIESLDERAFERDRFGVLVPRIGPGGGERLRVTTLDAVVVPGLAFDRSGRRLGRGAGYYDRLLVRLGPRTRAIGCGFAWQVVERVPTEGHDRRVDAVVTDLETVEPG
jgi:5-formyltetrahydrofolate cyclo-ligase